MPLYPAFPAATTSLSGGVILDGTAGDIAPDGVQAAGSSTKSAAADHVHGNNAWLSNYQAPTGATAETFPRSLATASSTTLTTQTLYLMAIGLPKGLQVSNITFSTKSTGTGGATITHAWYALLDSGLVVRAVSADQATSTTFLASTNTPYTLAMATPYTTTAAGLFYVGIMVQCGTMPNIAASGTGTASLVSASPVLCGSSSTGQTTPPSTGGAAQTAITAGAGFLMYAYTS